MKEAYTLNREFLFKTSIYEITSISLEDNYDIDGSFIEGEFIVSGNYRLHEISINKEDFSFKIPFREEIPSNINLDSINLEITDFNYDFQNEDELSVHIEYIITGDEAVLEFENEEKLEEFLEKQDVEVVDLSQNDADIREESSNEKQIDELLMINEENKEYVAQKQIESTKESEESKINEDVILNSVNNVDEYVTYHVHTVTMEDSIESICAKYNVNVNALKKYNTFDTLELNMKLLIPEDEES